MSYLPREGAPSSGPGAMRREDDAPRPGRHEDERHGLGRSFGLTALGTAIPGAGLSFTRWRRFGLPLLALTVAGLIAAGLYTARHGLVGTAARLMNGRTLITILVVVLVGAVIWVASIVSTARVSRPRNLGRGASRWHQLFTAVMCLVVIVPTVRVVQYITATRDMANTVFTHRYVGRGEPDAVAPKADAPDPWADTPRVNVLLIGSDAGPDRQGVRTDSMIVASINTHTGDTVLISIPRNLEGVPIPADNPLHKLYPNGYRCPDHSCLMDAIWRLADTQHPDLFPRDEANPGLDTTREVVQDIVGIPIDHTVVIDLHGFTQLVDAMGGVYINVPSKIAIGGEILSPGVIKPGSIKGYIQPGYQKLDGYDALWYSRSRVQTDDNDRMRRQRCMVNALVNQVNPVSMLQRFPALMEVAKENIQIDIPRDQLPAWATLVERAKHGNIRSVNLSPPTIYSGAPDFAKIRRLVKKALNTPHKPKPSASHSPTKKAGSTGSPKPTTPASPKSQGPISDTAASC